MESNLMSIPEAALPETDPLELERLFSCLRDKQLAANAGEGAPLTADESRYAIAITRILRRTNTGPKKARAASTKKKKMSSDDLAKLLGGDI